MRLFAGDYFPRFAVQSGDLPQPWVMPPGLPRAHRDRLAQLLAQALRTLDPALTLVQLRWAERRFLLSNRLTLPSSVLVWWRIDAVPAVDPQAVVLDGSRLTPGLSLFDFDQEVALPAEAWLGPLKIAMLHRVLDRLLDERPVAAYEDIADAVRELSAKLISPIDLVDGVEAMVEVEAQGEGLDAAKAEAVGRIVAARFTAGAVELAVRAIFAVGREKELHDAEREVLRKAGLADAIGLQPILDLLRDEQVLRRTVMQIAAQGRLEESIADLAPGLFPTERIVSSPETRLGVVVPQAQSKIEESSPAFPEPKAATVRKVLGFVARGDMEGGARLLLLALRKREDRAWASEDLRTAGLLLLRAAQQEEARQGRKMDAAILERIAALYETASELLERCGAAAIAATALCDAGRARGLLYRWSEAAALYERGRGLAEATGEREILAPCLVGLAEMKRRTGRASEAVEHAEVAAELFHALAMPSDEGMALRSLGDASVQVGEVDRARQTYARSLTAFDDAKDELGKAGTLLSQGRLWQHEGEFKNARHAFEKALSLSREHKDRLQEALAHEALGELSVHRKEPLRAREAQEEAASIYHELEDRIGEARALEHLGDARASVKDLALARDAYDAALLLTREMGNRQGEAALHVKYADVYNESGDRDGASREYEEALRIYEETGDRKGHADTLLKIAFLEFVSRRQQIAIHYYKQAAAEFREISEPGGLATASMFLGFVLQHENRHGEAREAFTAALDAAHAGNDEEMATQAKRMLDHMDKEKTP